LNSSCERLVISPYAQIPINGIANEAHENENKYPGNSLAAVDALVIDGVNHVENE